MGIVVVIIGTLMLGVVFILMMKQSIREGIGTWLAEKPLRIWLLPLLILGYYTIVALAIDQWRPDLFLVLAVYFGLPTLLLHLTGPKSTDSITGKGLVINFAVVLWIWLLIELNVVNTNWLRIRVKNGGLKDLTLGVHMAMIYALVVLSGWRRFDLKCDLSFKKSYLLPVLATTGVLGVILLLITVPTGLTPVGIAKDVKLNPLGLSLTVALPLAVLVGFSVIFLGLGVVEELVFRGAIQNLLGQRLKPGLALCIGSVVFGVAHVNNRAFGFDVPNWPFVGLATIAGVGYGLVFWKTGSVVASATVHTMIDLIWFLFLRGSR